MAASDDAPRSSAYTYGHSPAVVAVHEQRTAAHEAAFFLPHLRAGMRLLDAGCGPGSITVGLAAAVAPGNVVGIDVEPSVIARATALAAEQGVENVRFETASADALPFPDATCDAVFAHTLLEHLPDPAHTLRELRRVLRPGGLIGARDCDWASGVFAPPDPSMARAAALYNRVWRRNGGHPNSGRELGIWLHATGFTDVRTSASFRWDGTAASSRSFGELLATRLRLPNFVEPIVAAGWATAAELERISDGCEAWSRRPDAYAAMIMGQAVGRAA